jgi:hypothetical protein
VQAGRGYDDAGYAGVLGLLPAVSCVDDGDGSCDAAPSAASVELPREVMPYTTESEKGPQLSMVVNIGWIVVVVKALLLLKAPSETLEHRILVAAYTAVFAADTFQLAGETEHIAWMGERVFIVDEAMLALQE